MPYKYTTSKNFDRVLKKLKNKNKQIYENLLNKMDEIINIPDIEHYKNLRHDMSDRKRVHVGNFVLIFKYDKEKSLIYFDDFDHHDNIYE